MEAVISLVTCIYLASMEQVIDQPVNYRRALFDCHHTHYKPSSPIEIPNRRQSTISTTWSPATSPASPELIFAMSPLDAPTDVAHHTITFTTLQKLNSTDQDSVHVADVMPEDPFLYPFPVLPHHVNKELQQSSRERAGISVSVSPMHIPATSTRRHIFTSTPFWSSFRARSRSASWNHSTRAAPKIISNGRVSRCIPIQVSRAPSPLLPDSAATFSEKLENFSTGSETNSFNNKFEDHLFRRIDNEKFYQPISSANVLACNRR